MRLGSEKKVGACLVGLEESHALCLPWCYLVTRSNSLGTMERKLSCGRLGYEVS